MGGEAQDVFEYLSGLPDDRRQAIEAVRAVILDRLPGGYVEVMNWGMITYEVPLSVYPDTYNRKPLMYAALASQKRHMAVYFTCLYVFEDLYKRIVDEWRSRGTRLDMGKSCIRFKKLEHLELDLIGEAIGAVSMEDYVADEKARRASK
jgi:uncharacterized protein YdhG (YjbR/CyaY superfamily)